MIVAVFMDFATGKVSNRLILVGLLLSFFFFIVQGDRSRIFYYLLGIVTPVLLLLAVFMIRGIGAGDIKLFAVIGGFIGAEGVVYCIIISIIVGAILSLGKILVNQNFFVSIRNSIQYVLNVFLTRQITEFQVDKRNTIHFTLPMLIGVLCYIGGRI